MESTEDNEEMPNAQPAKMATSDESETPGAALNRAVRANEYLSVRHALPKTNISNVILYENTSQERHLVRQLSSLTLRRERQKNVLDLQRRAFVQKQTRKQKKWKREDEFSLNNMNLPLLDKKAEKRPNSTNVMYRNPDYELKSKRASDSKNKLSLPPLMEVKKEKTEIIFHRDKTFITKVPMSFSLNKETFKHHVSYCGQKYLRKGEAAQDNRFKRLSSSLNPTFGDHSEPIIGQRPNSASSSLSSRSSSRNKARQRSSKVLVPTKRMSATMGRRSAGSVHCKSVIKVERSKSDLVHTRETSAINRKDILSEFKNGDIRSLSKRLSAAE